MGNGNVYTDAGLVMHIHNGKADALVEYIGELQGEPCLVAYHFKHDLTAIKKAVPDIKVLHGDLNASAAAQMQYEWNEGKIPAMAVHPDSAGHGLNLQECHANRILWYSLTYDLDSYDQLNARLCRQGNESKTVFVDRLIAGKEDRVMAKALSEKTDVEQALLEAFEK
jgi:SNF2 family DNA or RNA helicase